MNDLGVHEVYVRCPFHLVADVSTPCGLLTEVGTVRNADLCELTYLNHW